jgi:hypothetical protein
MSRIAVVIPMLVIALPLPGGSQGPVRDSAGVRIVENARPAWPRGSEWTVLDRPTFDVGSGDDSLYQLLNVMGAVRLQDGRVAVANMSSGSVRIYDASGRYVRDLGRTGRGPAEFQQVMGIHRLAGDTLAVDDSHDEIEFFTPNGTHVRQLRLARGVRPLYLSGYFPFNNGTHARASWPQGHGHEPGRWLDSLAVVRYSIGDTNGTIISRHPAIEFTKTATLPFVQTVAFGPGGGIVGSGAGYYAGYADRYEIRHHRPDGALSLIVRAPWTPKPVTRDDAERFKEHTINLQAEGGGAVPARLLAQRRQMMDEVQFARNLPAYQHLVVDADRNLWVRDTYVEWYLGEGWGQSRVLSTPTAWRVFDPSGIWLGTVTLPARFNPMDIGKDYVLGLWRDEDDVEHIRIYRLRKPQDASL